MAERTCLVQGCERTYFAKGYCNTHYYRIRRNGTLDLKLKVLEQPVGEACDHCGGSMSLTKPVGRRWCSPRCATRSRRGRTAKPGRCEQCSAVIHSSARTDKRCCDPCQTDRRRAANKTRRRVARRAERTDRPRRWVAGWCRRCGDGFVTPHRPGSVNLYCSRSCTVAVVQMRRRARKHRAFVAEVSPVRIFERDGWRCRLCRRKVRRDAQVPHPLAPVLDHVIPLARGGTHEPSNVQCAHFRCNSRKGTSARYVEQLALIG